MTARRITAKNYDALVVLVAAHPAGLGYSNATSPGRTIYHAHADALIRAELATFRASNGPNVVVATDAGLELVARRHATAPTARVAAWSAVIHDVDDPLDRWAVDVVALVACGATDEEVLEAHPWPGGRKATGIARLETIRRLVRPTSSAG